MMELFNRMKGAATAVASQIGQSSWGTVTSVRDTDTGYEVKVAYQPWSDGGGTPVLSGWLPVLSAMVGGGWGIVCPPQVGQQAFIVPEFGDGEHGVVVGLAFSTKNRPPQPPNAIKGDAQKVVPGEVALVSKDGSIIRLCSGNKVYVKAENAEIEATNVHVVCTDAKVETTTAELTATESNKVICPLTTFVGDVEVQGSMWAKVGADGTGGDVSDRHGSLDRLRGNYDGHQHTDVQNGTGTTGLTTKPDPE